VADRALRSFDLAGFRITRPGGLRGGEGQSGKEENGFHGRTIGSEKVQSKKSGPGLRPNPLAQA
jgi:hypothetical protein